MRESVVVRVDEEVYRYILDARHKLEARVDFGRSVSFNTALRFLLSLDKLAWIK